MSLNTFSGVAEKAKLGTDANPLEKSFVDQFHVFFLAGLFCEALRRTVWATLRVENEMINNFEGYRTFNHIPAMDEDALVGIGLEQNDRYMREKKINEA